MLFYGFVRFDFALCVSLTLGVVICNVVAVVFDSFLLISLLLFVKFEVS